MKLHLTQALKRLALSAGLIILFNQANSQLSLTLTVGKDTILPLKQSSPTDFELTATITGTPTLIQWTKLSGGVANILQPLSEKTLVTDLQEGNYSFVCEVLGGLLPLKDTINIKVVNFQHKNQVPCRQGTPRVWVLSATNTTDLYQPYLRKSGFDIQGGDTIKINRNPTNGGVYNRIYLGDFGGSDGCPVVVVPNGQVVEIGGANARWFIGTNTTIADTNFVNHVVIDGTYLRNKTGDKYGFKSTGNNFGMGARLVTDLDIKGCVFENNSLAIQIKIFSDSLYPWTVYDNFIMKNIKIHDSYFRNIVGSEGLYIGNTDPSGTAQAGNDGAVPRLDSVFIYDNIINGTAWDPIQTSAARYTEIHDNIVLNGSTLNQSSQNWGILMGANCTGKIYNNVMYNGKGGTVGTLGYGATEISYNYIDSVMGGTGTSDGIYADMKTANILEAQIPAMFPPLRLNILNNIVARFERNAIYHADNQNLALPGTISGNYVIEPTRSLSQVVRSNGGDVVSNNTLVRSFPVTIRDIGSPATGPLVQVTQGAFVDTFSRAKDIIDWLFQKLNGGTPPPPPNQPPVANAGQDQTITLPVNSVTLNGSASDPDGSVASSQWSKISGPASFSFANASALQTTVTSLSQGVYSFKLLVTDNQGVSASDTIVITVNAAVPPPNQPPVANAGQDQTITLPVNSVTLNGTASDSDGSIAAYNWSKLSGPSSFAITSPSSAQTTITNLVEGTYQFVLQVTDNNSATASDTLAVTVNAAVVGPPPPPPANQSPLVNAGADQIITLPVNSVSLTGSASDPDGSIASYMWTKISGPASFSFASASSLQTPVSNLTEGVYSFRLTVSDDKGASASDTVTITVNAVVVPPPPANQPPAVNAGNNITITLPVNSVTLTASASDPDGFIASYQWTKLSGPSQFVISSASSAQTAVNSLVQGTYSFRIMVTDNNGTSAADTVTVTVNAAPPPPPPAPNQAPIANAGEDKTLISTSTAKLQGSGVDPDGIIVAYKWRQLSPQILCELITPSQPQSDVAGLQDGIYSFELEVTDNRGAKATDTVLIEVKNITSSSASIYPNPTTGPVTISIEAQTKTNLTSLTIYDVTGKIVYYENFMRTAYVMTKQIDLSSLISGTYFIEVSADINKKTSVKLIKE